MKKVKLKAFVSANLGDDLFLDIICNRYPNTQFIVTGSKKYKSVYGYIKNLKYISNDTTLIRTTMTLQRKFASVVNSVCKKQVIPAKITDAAVEEKYSQKADVNVYITGSGFMNSESEFETLPKKQLEEKRYYDRKPYLLGCNFGPYAHNEYLEMYRALFKQTSDICFRDTYSLSLFPDVKQARWAPDVVFNYPKDNETNSIKKDYGKFMLISVANLKKDEDDASGYYENYINFVRKIVEDRNRKGLHTVLAGFCNAQKDDETIRLILDGINNSQYNHIYCYPDSSKDEILALFNSCDSVLATRYHAMVLALLYQKKVCAICYNEKTTHVLNDIDQDFPYITLEEMDRLTPERVENEKIYQVSKEKIESLVELAQLHFKYLDKALK